MSKTISMLLDEIAVLEESKKSLIAQLKANNGLYRSLLSNKAVSDGMRGKLLQQITLNNLEINKKS